MKEKETVQTTKCTNCADGVLLIRVSNFLHYLHFCSNALQKMVMPLTSSEKLKYETYSTKSIRPCLSLTQNLALTQTMTMTESHICISLVYHCVFCSTYIH